MDVVNYLLTLSSINIVDHFLVSYLSIIVIWMLDGPAKWVFTVWPIKDQGSAAVGADGL